MGGIKIFTEYAFYFRGRLLYAALYDVYFDHNIGRNFIPLEFVLS